MYSREEYEIKGNVWNKKCAGVHIKRSAKGQVRRQEGEDEMRLRREKKKWDRNEEVRVSGG